MIIWYWWQFNEVGSNWITRHKERKCYLQKLVKSSHELNLSSPNKYGPVHKGSESRSATWLGSWFELRAFTSIATAVSITNRICALRGNILYLLRWLTLWSIHGFPTHFQNDTQIAFRKSSVLRIRLSRLITIPYAIFLRISRPWFERALCSQRVKSGFRIRKGSESWSETAFRRDLLFVNRPHVTCFVATGTFSTDSKLMCIHEQNVYTTEPGKIQVRTFQVSPANWQQLLSCAKPMVHVVRARVRFPPLPSTFLLQQDTLSTLLFSTQVYK